MRNRMLNPGIWTNEDFSKMSFLARLIWIGLISSADDEGRGKANLSFLKSTIFPYDDELSLKKIENSLKEIKNFMKIDFYEVDGKKFYQLKNWKKFQNINRPTPSQIPECAENTEEKETKIIDNSLQSQQPLTEGSVNNHEVHTEGSVPKKEIEKEIYKYKENSLTRVKESEKEGVCSFGEFKNVFLTKEEHDKLLEEKDGEKVIEFYSQYKKRTGYNSKSDYLAILDWAKTAFKEKKQREEKLSAGKLSSRRDYSKEEMNSLFQKVSEIEI